MMVAENNRTGVTVKVAFFDAKRYDREYFERINRQFGLEIDYFESRTFIAFSAITS